MPQDLTANAMHWADIGDNRIGPIMRELIEAIADCHDPHEVRRIARNLKFLSSSICSMAHQISDREAHDRSTCSICKTGAIL